MTRDEAIRRLFNIERCTPIHTREDVRDFEALEMAIKALEQEPCDDAISRKAVLDTTICEGISCNECSFNEIDGEPGCLLHARIDELPPVTAEPKTGHWIDNPVRKNLCNCSECNGLNNVYSAFCPNCGAKMVEPQESEE